ncbi:FGGY-family carbohydrate kinase [Aurantimonas sp. Leaf443]|uniref:FGGY-family carbohydrate kinase n=1 Tax=Aurantimonas sp. Leaf443 TaxID=1736378 RepID=UPI0006F99417|nr:FGGY-family carbohydrate kinase [Aurantimonas sp. Leaf443]KQT85101.1 hypothetical protein ASG48_07395 [Aurantimonas sp. Leaf443]
MSEARFVAVVDIGKTNAKLALHDLDTRRDLFVATRPNTPLDGPPYRHFDVEGLWAFLLGALMDCAARHPVEAICVTTHGACAALVGDAGLVLPILDYESEAPQAGRTAYEAERPPFAETFSPPLPNGLNVGAQLFYLEKRFPDAFARARHLLFYPQYWAWRLTGVAASEVTSLGCHTDLWAPERGAPSSLARRRGWDRLMPPLRSAFDALGPLREEIALAVGLGGRAVPVHCGIHDSNASLLPHLLSRPAPLAVVSTGTWIIALAVGGTLRGLDPARDTLANVDALGRPVPSARFMGGREFDLLTERNAVTPQAEEIADVLEHGPFVLPTLAPGTGPAPGGSGAWSADPAALSPGARTAAATLYCALMTLRMLDTIGAKGPTVVEGPFARNALYVESLAALTRRPVIASDSATGTTAGSALLARGADVSPSLATLPPPARRDTRVEDYRRRWEALVGARCA